MSRPSKHDILVLSDLRKGVQKLMKRYNDLDRETRDFLREEFNGETLLHLTKFDNNVRDAIEELERFTECK